MKDEKLDEENEVSSVDSVETSDEEVNAPAATPMDELTAKCEEYLNGWRRAQADYQNLVKETDLRKIEFIRYANEDLIGEILPVLDNFKIAFRQIPEAEKDSAWVVGFSYIKKQLEDVLKNHNVEEIKTVGTQFDPVEHEAIEHIQRDGVKSGEIVEERQAGYKLNGKVIQPAKVVAAE